MSAITTHVLDTARGCPAAGIPVVLEKLGEDWSLIGSGTTNSDGRIKGLLGEHPLTTGTWRITFELTGYQEGFYPYASIVFRVANASQHHHVPLLLSPYGYSTYRGS